MKTRLFLSFPFALPKLSFSYRLLLFGCKGTHAILQPI